MSKAIPSALDPDDGAMYRSERKIYPRDVEGRFDRLRSAAVVWLLGMYYLAPWVSWDGRQSVLFDLPARRFYILGLSFWPQDFVFLALLLILAGLSLFFFTALAGRLWCGYACPQTVWTEVFIWMERWTEGDRAKRMKLDAAPWSAEKWRRKLAKHSLWLLFALWTGFTFVGFFTPIRDLGARLMPFEWGGWELFWVLFYSLATWGNAGFLREQVCKYMCPYARFQGAMFDRDTLIISYDQRRGEPRGRSKRFAVGPPKAGLGTGDWGLGRAADEGAANVALKAGIASPKFTAASLPATPTPSPQSPAPALGDCIDCTICVQVCPTGIDIRNGLQYECIACGACIDACDAVMDKVGYPRGLIRYTTQNAVDGKPTRVLRPRVLIYGALLGLILLGWAVGISQRSPLIVDVLRDRNALYRIGTAGSIENGYTLKLSNKRDAPMTLLIEIAATGPVTLATAPLRVDVPPGDTLNLPVTLRAPADSLRGKHAIAFVVSSESESSLRVRHASAFFGPAP